MDLELKEEQKASLEKDISTIQRWVKKTLSITKNELINSTNQIFKNLIIDIDESIQQTKNDLNSDDSILNQKKELAILHEKLQRIENERSQLIERNDNLTKRLDESTKRNISQIQNDFDAKFQKKAESLTQENSDLKIEILNLKNKISTLTQTPVDFETTGDGDVFSELQNHFNHLSQEKENLQSQLEIEKQNAQMCKNKSDLAKAENENLTILMDIMKSEYNELTQQIADYRQDCQDYERKIQDANKEIQENQINIKELKNRNQSLISEMKMKDKDDDSNSKLSEMNSLLKTEKDRLQNEKGELLNLIDNFNKKQLETNHQLSSLETQNYNYKKIVSDQEKTINDLKSQLVQYEKQNQTMSDKINQIENQLLENYNEKEMLLKTQENAQKEIDSLKRNSNNRSSAVIDGLNKQISDLMETQRALYSQIEYQQIEATAHKSQIENLEQQLDETTSLLKNTNEGDKFESFSKKLEEMQIENEALHKKLIQNQDQMNKIADIETLKSVNKTLRQTQNELKTELLGLKKELSKCISEISTLKAQNKDITNHIDQLKPENISLREKQQQLIKISQNVQESNRDLTRQNLEKDKRNKYLNEKVEKLSEELSILKTRNEELESLIKKHHIKTNSDEEIEEEEEDNSILRRNLEIKKNEDSKNAEKIAKLLSEITKIKSEKKALRTRLLKIINMCKSLQKTKAESIQEKEQLTKEIDQLQSDYMKINEKNSKLTSDNQKLRKKNLKLVVYAKQLKKTRQELTEQLNNINNNENDNENDNENENENDNANNTNKKDAKDKENQEGNVDQSIQVTLQHSIVQEEEDIDEIKRLNDQLNAKIIEMDKIRRQHKKEMSKLQKENSKLKAKHEELQEKIKNEPKNHKNDDDISEIKEAQMSELRFQNDALKRKIELQAQNYELDILDLQTEIAQKDQEIKQLQENIMNNSEDNTEIQQLKAKNADLQSQLSHLMQDRNRAGSRRGFYPDSSINNFDDFELKAQKFKDTLLRQFTQINLRVKSLDSKISFLKYRLKLRRNTKETLVIPKSLYSVMQLLGVKKRTKKANLEQISDDLYKALLKKEEYSENEDAFESLAEVMQLDTSNERDILEEAYRQFKYLKSVEIKFKNSQNIIDNIRRLIEKETDNDDFADTVRLLFVSNKD